MKISRKLLRAFARKALEERGYCVQLDKKRGVAPGARLKISKNDEAARIAAVRTSLKRKIGLLRKKSGQWRTIPDVDEVVVAVPLDYSKKSIEVIGFDPKDILKAFNAALKHHKDLSADAPIFVSLDSDNKGPAYPTALLTKKAKWKATFEIDGKTLKSLQGNENQIGLIARFKREFAELNGVDESKVEIQFRIIE